MRPLLPTEDPSETETAAEYNPPTSTPSDELEDPVIASFEPSGNFGSDATSPEEFENPVGADDDLDESDKKMPLPLEVPDDLETTASSTGGPEESTRTEAFDRTNEEDPPADGASPFSDHLPIEELDDPPTTEDAPLPDFLSTPSLEARQAETTSVTKSNWAKVAQQEGYESLVETWRAQVGDLTRTVRSLDMARQPKLCPAITGSVIDSCKKGVRTQVAFCKQSLKDIIAGCKNDVKRSIDQCKKDVGPSIDQCKDGVRQSVDKCKRKAKWPFEKPKCELARAPGMAKCESARATGSAKCEATRGPDMLKCEAKRVDIPFCEFDRLTASCCEGLRTHASAMCHAGLSTTAIQKQVQSAQAVCSVTTGIAKAAMKSYLSGQALGLITQLESVKAIGDTVQVIRKAEQTRAQFDQWTSGLEAAAEGRMQDAQKALGSLAFQISPSISNAVAWAEAAEAAVAKKVDEFVAKASKAAGELDAIKTAKESIKTLNAVADNINAIRAAAVKCATIPEAIKPNKYNGWKRVKSEADVEAAVETYKKKVARSLRAAAKCQAVVTRVQRVLE